MQSFVMIGFIQQSCFSEDFGEVSEAISQYFRFRDISENIDASKRALFLNPQK
jgi:hypothetical protein